MHKIEKTVYVFIKWLNQNVITRYSIMVLHWMNKINLQNRCSNRLRYVQLFKHTTYKRKKGVEKRGRTDWERQKSRNSDDGGGGGGSGGGQKECFVPNIKREHMCFYHETHIAKQALVLVGSCRFYKLAKTKCIYKLSKNIVAGLFFSSLYPFSFLFFCFSVLFIVVYLLLLFGTVVPLWDRLDVLFAFLKCAYHKHDTWVEHCLVCATKVRGERERKKERA